MSEAPDSKGGDDRRHQLASDGTDEEQLRRWEAGCLADMRRKAIEDAQRNGAGKLPDQVTIARFEIAMPPRWR